MTNVLYLEHLRTEGPDGGPCLQCYDAINVPGGEPRYGLMCDVGKKLCPDPRIERQRGARNALRAILMPSIFGPPDPDKFLDALDAYLDARYE